MHMTFMGVMGIYNVYFFSFEGKKYIKSYSSRLDDRISQILKTDVAYLITVNEFIQRATKHTKYLTKHVTT